MKVIHAKIVPKTKKMFLFRCEKIFYLSILFKKIFCFEISHTKFLAVLEDLKESPSRSHTWEIQDCRDQVRCRYSKGLEGLFTFSREVLFLGAPGSCWRWTTRGNGFYTRGIRDIIRLKRNSLLISSDHMVPHTSAQQDRHEQSVDEQCCERKDWKTAMRFRVNQPENCESGWRSYVGVL